MFNSLTEQGKSPPDQAQSTRFGDISNAEQRLECILNEEKLKAASTVGMAKNHRKKLDSQKVVCFSEAPVQFASTLVGTIKGRRCNYEPFGIAFLRSHARERGVNPVWYIDTTPNHDWLTRHVDQLVKSAAKSPKNFDNHPISKIIPYFETMGSGGNNSTGDAYKKEFWWEREWRHVGDFYFPEPFLVFCPESKRAKFKRIIRAKSRIAHVIDPHWALETMKRSLSHWSYGKHFLSLEV